MLYFYALCFNAATFFSRITAPVSIPITNQSGFLCTPMPTNVIWHYPLMLNMVIKPHVVVFTCNSPVIEFEYFLICLLHLWKVSFSINCLFLFCTFIHLSFRILIFFMLFTRSFWFTLGTCPSLMLELYRPFPNLSIVSFNIFYFRNPTLPSYHKDNLSYWLLLTVYFFAFFQIFFKETVYSTLFCFCSCDSCFYDLYLY